MKLLFCTACHDLIRLHPQVGRERRCDCGKSSGHYEDEAVAFFNGPCVSLGVDNNSLAKAVRTPNTPLTPYENLAIMMFRFRSDAKHVKVDSRRMAEQKRETERLLAFFEEPRKIK
jgi:hypothetical protein